MVDAVKMLQSVCDMEKSQWWGEGCGGVRTVVGVDSLSLKADAQLSQGCCSGVGCQWETITDSIPTQTKVFSPLVSEVGLLTARLIHSGISSMHIF